MPHLGFRDASFFQKRRVTAAVAAVVRSPPELFENDEKCGHVLSGVLVSAFSITVAFGSSAAAQQAKRK